MGFEALELALALHAAPGRIAELRARPLPTQGMAPLLRVALGQPDALAEAAEVFPGEQHRLVEAARFFIEQQLLAREFDHDPWRVLGVNPGAPPELLRAHHHLLVRLVHPDRSDDWASAYADRVNRAWRQLRHEDGRAAALRAAPAPAVGEPWEAQVPVPRPRAPSRPPPAPARPGTSPWIGLATGVALTLAATLAWQRLRPQVPASVPAPAPETATTPATPSSWMAAAAPLPATAGVVPLPELVPIARLDPGTQATGAPAAEPPSSTTTTPEPRRARATASTTRPSPPTPTRRAAAAPAATPPPALAIAETPAAPAVPVDPVEPRPVSEAPASTVATETAPPPVQPDGPALLRSYRDRYAAGDLGGLLGLYAREVHADTRRIGALARDYARLFGNSQQRYIDFSAVRWERRGERLLGQARYETGYRKGAALRKHLERGDVAVEVVLDGATSRLRRFELRAD